MGYLGNFIVYLLAMVGLIILALFVYKKFNVNALGVKSNHTLKVEDTLSLSARKSLYIIRNGSERFLIAADFDRTTLISKLEDSPSEVVQAPQRKTRRVVKHNVDLSEDAINMQDNVAPIRKPIMKEIRSKLNF